MKTFPMFLKMAGREVLIVGGGEQAAQKARLMQKTEARLTLIAPDLDPELQALVDEGRASHEPGPVTSERFRGAALVFVATGCAGADLALHRLVRLAGAPVNVVDRPDLCDAYTPSIVDRDPVVVAIGTEGTAPVLARQIKSRVETLLEPRLGDLAAMAGRMRGAVTRHVPQARRRDLWRWVFSAAPRQLHAAGAERAAARALKEAIARGGAPDRARAGRLSVIATGPGAADLLTLRAVQRLQEADVIYADPGLDPQVLDLARRDAARVLMGGAGWPADRVAQVILGAAGQGRHVVRLIAGTDGQGAESLAHAAAEAGVTHEVLPCVGAGPAGAPGAQTSSVTGPASASTTRVSHSVQARRRSAGSRSV